MSRRKGAPAHAARDDRAAALELAPTDPALVHRSLADLLDKLGQREKVAEHRTKALNAPLERPAPR